MHYQTNTNTTHVVCLSHLEPLNALDGAEAADGGAVDGGGLTHAGGVGVQQLTHIHRGLWVHLEREGPRHTDGLGPGEMGRWGGEREREREKNRERKIERERERERERFL